MNTVPLRILLETHRVIDEVLRNDSNKINVDQRLELAGMRGRIVFYIQAATKDIELEMTQ